MLNFYLKISDSVGLVWGLRISISKIVSGEADVPGWVP